MQGDNIQVERLMERNLRKHRLVSSLLGTLETNAYLKRLDDQLLRAPLLGHFTATPSDTPISAHQPHPHRYLHQLNRPPCNEFP